MGIAEVITTLFGSMMFPLLIGIGWGRGVDAAGAFGGIVIGGMIVGSSWIVNHSVGLVYQSGGPWVDMAWAAFVGLLINNYAPKVSSGEDISKAMPSIIAGTLGGVLGGIILYLGVF